jgi:hypothetical protein
MSQVKSKPINGKADAAEANIGISEPNKQAVADELNKTTC